jgi:hypothetical protein
MAERGENRASRYSGQRSLMPLAMKLGTRSRPLGRSSTKESSRCDRVPSGRYVVVSDAGKVAVALAQRSVQQMGSERDLITGDLLAALDQFSVQPHWDVIPPGKNESPTAADLKNVLRRLSPGRDETVALVWYHALGAPPSSATTSSPPLCDKFGRNVKR